MNGNEFLTAVDTLEKEKNIDRDIIFEAMELALLSAYKKNFNSLTNAKVNINRDTGDIKIYSYKTVVEEVEDPEVEISLIVQKIREAERESLNSEFKDKEGELISGVVALEDENNYYIDLGRTNGILPKSELIKDEKIEMGSTIKAYVTKVNTNTKGTVILLSRSHYNFVKRLFELEIPELADGSVIIYGVARDAGSRSKVAVYSEYANIDPIGCCIGEKGSRISNIIKELSGEKLDIVRYSEDKEEFIANALNPAKDVSVYILDPKKCEALAIADGDNFSLALGKKGQNVRLASRLTKYKIDVKNGEQVKEMGISIKANEE